MKESNYREEKKNQFMISKFNLLATILFLANYFVESRLLWIAFIASCELIIIRLFIQERKRGGSWFQYFYVVIFIGILFLRKGGA